MKKIMFFAAVCAALVSCSKEEKINTPIEGGKPCVLTATIDLGSSGTKVTPDLANISSTLSFKWEVDDIVTISNEAGTESQEFTVKSIDSKGVATLTGTALSSMTSYKVSYGTASATVDYQEGTFTPIITGTGANNSFTLDTYCPVLKLKLTGENTITSIKYYVGSTLNTTLNISNGITLSSTEQVVYFPVIGTAEEKGAKLDFCNGDNVLMRQTLPVAVAANDFIALPVLSIAPYFCFTSLQDGSSVSISDYAKNKLKLEYKTEKEGEEGEEEEEGGEEEEEEGGEEDGWQSIDDEWQSITLNKGEKVYFRAGEDGNVVVGNSFDEALFSTSGKLKVSGNIMYLLNQSGSVTNLTPGNNNSCFQNLFNGGYGGSAITDAGDLVLPATTLATDCYSQMFYGCSNLTSAPALPATTLATNCYNEMFFGCSNLNVAPALPATTLAKNCYNQMFVSCINLTSAPALLATSLAESCYSNMFNGCTALTSAPALPATTLVKRCYYQMFNACTGLTTAPTLSATTLAEDCYQNMFYGCSKLSSVTMLATDVSASNCLTNWLNNAGTSASSRTLKVASGMSTNATITDTNNTPSNWTITE